MSKKIVLLLGALSAGILVAQAQIGTQPDWGAEVAIIKAQPLVVLLDDEDPKELRQLANKPAELTQYKAYVALHNTQLQQLAPKLWQFSPTVEFKSEAEYEELRKAKGAKTVVLHQTRQLLGQAGSLSADVITWMNLELVGNGNKENIWHGPSSSTVVYPSDILFTFRNLQRDLQEKAADAGKTVTNRQSMARMVLQDVKHTQQLKTKTLLINRAEVPDKLTEAEIAQQYPYPFQLVPLQTIETAVLAGDARYAYVRWLTVTAGEVGPSIIDAADSQLITTTPSSKTELAKIDFQRFARHVTNMDRYAKQMAKIEEAAK